MNPVVRNIIVWIVLTLAGAGAGCGTTGTPPGPRMPLVTVAISTSDGVPPTHEQLAKVLGALTPELQRAGFDLAPNQRAAHFVVSVRFTRTPEGEGGRVTVTGLEPTVEFRAALDAAETPEAKEWRRRQREYETWVERQREP